MKHPSGIELRQLASRPKNSRIRDVKATQTRRQDKTQNIARAVDDMFTSRLVIRRMTQQGTSHSPTGMPDGLRIETKIPRS